jgi:hypothetical protein
VFTAGSSPGAFAVNPTAPQVSDSVVPVTYSVTLGDGGLQAGGSLVLAWSRAKEGSKYRLSDAVAAASRAGASFDIAVNPGTTSDPVLLRPTLRSGALQAGDVVSVRGTMRYPGLVTYAGVIVRPTASGPETTLPQRPTLRVRAGRPAKIWVTAEPRPVAGRPARVNVAVLDRAGNPVPEFRGNVTLTANSPVSNLPASYSFTAADAGAHEFSVKFPMHQVYRIVATSAGIRQDASNPVLPRSSTEKPIYFGELHTHTALSGDGIGDPDGAYVWSDSVRGHRNVYYRTTGPAMPQLPNNMEALWAYLDQNGINALTVPHHPNNAWRGKEPWNPADWSVASEKYQRVVELFQSRGSFEVPGGPDPELRILSQDYGSSVQTALSLGNRVGFIASTDFHMGLIGTRLGATAVYGTTLTREGIYDAMARLPGRARSGFPGERTSLRLAGCCGRPIVMRAVPYRTVFARRRAVAAVGRRPGLSFPARRTGDGGAIHADLAFEFGHRRRRQDQQERSAVRRRRAIGIGGMLWPPLPRPGRD